MQLFDGIDDLVFQLEGQNFGQIGNELQRNFHPMATGGLRSAEKLSDFSGIVEKKTIPMKAWI